MTFKPTRRAVVAGGVAGLAGSMTMDWRAFAQSLPTSPVTLNIVDVAGNLALTQKAIENYRNKNPNLVSRITFTKAPAPELPGKIKAQQDANRVDIDLVLTGTDALVGRRRPEALDADRFANTRRKLPKLDDIYLPGAAKMQALAARSGRRRRVLPRRPAARIHARQGEAGRRPRPKSCSPGRRPIRTASSMRARPIPVPAAPS